jgi:hypothetical protein
VVTTLPGYPNSTIGASNINSLAVDYNSCRAPITFTNGLRQPTQPSASNGATTFTYAYTISDGSLFSVTANLTITTSSAFATTTDPLGNPYQSVVNIAGTRTYTYLPTSTSLTSTVSGPVSGTIANFYPYSLLASAPGVYTVATAPFLDLGGLTYYVTPEIPFNGNPTRAGLLANQQTVSVVSWAQETPHLDEQWSVIDAIGSLQQQVYIMR